MVKYGFFNAKKLITGDYDRKYNADDVNAYFKGAISKDGIYQFVGNQCRVVPAGNMNVYVRDGKGQINYHWFEVTSNEMVSIREAHATLNRYTAIVARYDAANRNIYLLAVDGAESERPSKPQLQKTDMLRDICLAYVYVGAGTNEITRDDIEDTVEDIEVCGFVETLLRNDSAAVKVRQLPTPSKSCQGNIYYLIEESKTAGKTYIKGYYYCEPSNTTYDFIDCDFTSDILSNRPVASEDYIDILFYANDNNTWYKCVETNKNNYEWQEVIVNEVEELPEPTEELNNQFYIIGNTLYKVAKQESNYKWYMFGTGRGGGHGDFAIIRIEYPEGTEVQVTFDDDTIDAPDTSGIWIYGCDKAGTYVVGIKNSSTTKEVEIATSGQVETIFISPQVINYALIYYLGNEFAEPTEEEKKYAIKTGGWALQYLNQNSARNAYATTLVNIDSTGFSGFAQYVKNPGNSDSNYKICSGYRINTNPGSGGNIVVNKYINQSFAASNGIMYKNDNISSIENNIFVTSFSGVYIVNPPKHTEQKSSNHFILGLASNATLSNPDRITNIYMMTFYKQDNISGLSAYGSTISEILNNASSLFDDTVALNWMVLNCTGDFMISALSNANFVNAMNTSANKSILVANEHWNRFIALLSV